MKYVVLIVLIGGGYLAWKKFGGGAQEPAAAEAVTDSHKTPGANAENRVNGLSGSVPDP